jgi:hypothetical protein
MDNNIEFIEDLFKAVKKINKKYKYLKIDAKVVQSNEYEGYFAILVEIQKDVEDIYPLDAT